MEGATHPLLLAMQQEGVHSYVQNVRTTLHEVAEEELFLPLTQNEAEYENSYVVSNTYFRFYAQKQLKARFPRLTPLLSPLFSLLSLSLKLLKVNRVVLVNNWLLTTSLYPPLTAEQTRSLLAKLRARFPGYLLVFRHLIPHLSNPLLHALKEEGLKLIRTRSIFLYDPQSTTLSRRAQRHRRQDAELIERHGYTLVRSPHLSSKDFVAMRRLYRKIYLEKHTPYSPDYTEKYLEKAQQSGFMDFICVKKEGRIDACIGIVAQHGAMAVPFVGYDNESAASSILYRIVMELILTEAEKRGAILNDGSGGEKAKTYRGLRPHPEFTAIDTSTLSWSKRLLWKLF